MRATRSIAALALAAFSTLGLVAQTPTTYHMVKKIALDTDGGFDYLSIDQEARRLYVSHGNEVDVIDIDADTFVGKIAGLEGTHGIAIAPRSGHGFITSGRNAIVREFDLKTLATIADIPAPGGPDAILYEPKTDRVFAMGHRNGSITAIDAKSGAVLGQVVVGGALEFAATDRNGTFWVNAEDKNMVAKIDAATLKVISNTAIAGCEGPTGMDIDREHRLLFIGCGETANMAVVNADTSAVLSLQPIGKGTDATWYDPSAKLIINAVGGGMNVTRQESKDKYSVAQMFKTEGRTHTVAIDFKTHKVYTATGLAGPAPAPVDGKPAGRPTMLPGSAAVYVYQQ